MQRLAQELARLRSESRHRSLSLPRGIDFTSNDYLGLAGHPALRAGDHRGAGRRRRCGRSRRLAPAARPPARRMPSWKPSPRASSAARRRSTSRPAFSPTSRCSPPCRTGTTPSSVDELVHASVKEGVHAGHARLYQRPPQRCRRLRGRHRPGARRAGARDVWIAVESVYSMDGDIAPIADLHALARAHDAVLIVDEAHGTGIFGATGRGFTEGRYDERLIVLHTCGKALGVAGGLVCGPAVVDRLPDQRRAAVHLFDGAAALRRRRRAPRARAGRRGAVAARTGCWRCRRLRRRAAGAQRAAAAVAAAGTQIIPVILGAEAARGRRPRRRCSGAASTCAPSARRRCRRAPRGCASRSAPSAARTRSRRWPTRWPTCCQPWRNAVPA